jgi:hypothetical protein
MSAFLDETGTLITVSSSNPLPTSYIYSAVASDGVLLPLSSLTETNTYSGGQIATSSVTYLGNTYTQTFTWTLGNLATISQWVKQS